MNTKKLSRYRNKLNSYLSKAGNSENPGKKLTVYNKILKIIKKLRFIEQKGKVSIKPSLIKLERIFTEGKKDIADEVNESRGEAG